MAKSDWSDRKQKIFDRAKLDSFALVYASIEKKVRKEGNLWVMGLCPFHDDHNPSFGFNTETGRWNCFSGCGNGSWTDFAIRVGGGGFGDALDSLGES